MLKPGTAREAEYDRLTAAIVETFRALEAALDAGHRGEARRQRARLAVLRTALAAWTQGELDASARGADAAWPAGAPSSRGIMSDTA
jgi:hypothetical protein